MWWSTVAFVFLFGSQLVSSQLEGNLGEFHFTIPDVTRNFSDAVTWCKTNNNSTLAVVNDSSSQMALARFLDASDWNSWLYINVKLFDKPDNTFFLISGSKYVGLIGNQNNGQYFLNCRLRCYDNGDSFKVEAAFPSWFGNYICDYEENRCSGDSANYVVYNGRCYMKYENESLTWYKARERCVYSGGDLAQFDGFGYNAPFSTSYLNKSLTYWVGIRWNDRSWKSSDGDEYIFTSWSKDRPNNYDARCVCLNPKGDSTGNWSDSDCTTQRQFVCLRRDTTTTSKTTISVTPTANMAWPSNSTTTSSNMLTVGLVLGIAGILPLVIIIVVLVVVILRLRRQLRDKPQSNESVNHVSKDTAVKDGRIPAEPVTPVARYQHVRTDSRRTTMMPHYDQLDQPDAQIYEPMS